MKLKPPIGARLDRDHPLSYGLSLAYLCNERGGSTVFDASGHGNRGALTNVEHVPEGLSFNGSDAYLSFADSLEPGTQDWWVAFMLRLDSYPSLGQEMAICGNVSNANSDGIFINCNGDIFFRIGGTLGTKLDDSPIPLHEWTNIVIAREYSSNLLTVYINGSKGLIFDTEFAGNAWRNKLTSVYSWTISDGGAA